jgi:hypothetical protein
MTEKEQSPSKTDVLEPARKLLVEKNARITALEAALPTLGSGLVAEAIVYYLVALNADYFAACCALADIANKAPKDPAPDVPQNNTEEVCA